MIPDSHRKEFLSHSYLTAVAAQAGYGCEIHHPDYGIDATISEMQKLKNGKIVPSGLDFDIQLKSTHLFSINNNLINYALEADAYNKLVSRKVGLIVLVLFCVPKVPIDRLSLNENQLELRNCCYWEKIVGNFTSNTSSITIHIPRNHIFNPECCRELMEYAKSGVQI